MTAKKITKLEIRLSARDIRTYYSVIMHSSNELMDIVRCLYSEYFKALTGDETASPMSDSTIKYWMTKRSPQLRKSVALPLPMIMQFCSEEYSNPIMQAHFANDQTILLGHWCAPRYRYEFGRYDLEFLEDGLLDNSLTHKKYPNLPFFHMELNPHMTIDFALKYYNYNWDLCRLAKNAAIKWCDLELFIQKCMPESYYYSNNIRRLALSYLENPNLTVEEFKKISLLLVDSSITHWDVARVLSENLFAWHPVIYDKHIAAARQDRKELMREHICDVISHGIAAVVLHYSDCI
jgi:hypothetical protein